MAQRASSGDILPTLPAASGPADAATPPAPSRAGRDLPAAIAVGVSLAAVILISLFTVRWVFTVVVMVAVTIGIGELARALRLVGASATVPPLLVGSPVMVGAAYLGGTEALLFTLTATVLACWAWRLPYGAPGFVRDVASSVFIAVYVPFLAGFAVLLLAQPQGAWRVVAFVATTVCSDIGGYVTGVLKGRHPMAPSVSPKKSWEGFAGGALTCVACGSLVVANTVDGVAWWEGVILGLVVVCAATLGDLGESLLKRDIGVKDMGRLLPGHGGIMDRLDSLLVVAPLVWALLSVFAPVPS